MIRYDCIQGSPEWVALHIGRPTASNADRLLTVKTRKPSAQAEKFAIEICTGWLLGQLPDAASTGWTMRGLELETPAIAYYEFQKDVTVDRVGFVTTDDGRVGCSPDFLVGDDGGGEIKCLSAVNHVGALLGATDDSYVLQVQWCLWVTERQWWDRIWFNPAILPLIIRVERDEKTIGQIAEAVDVFCERLDEMKARLLVLGCKPKLGSLPGAVELLGGRAPAAAPGPSRRERAAELAKAYLALGQTEEATEIQLRYMLSLKTVADLEQSIIGLPGSMLDELNADIGCIAKGI